MVVRSFSWKVPHFHRLLRYISKDSDHPERIEIRHNLRPDQDISEQFWENESYRKRGTVTCFHEVLSFHKDDTVHLSREVIEDLVTHYLDLRAPNSLAFGMSHHDRDHVHVHLMISAVELRSSRSAWLGKEQFASVQQELERYQQARYPELQSVVHEPSLEPHQGVERGWEGQAIAHFRESARLHGRRAFYARCEEALVEDVIARCYAEAESREDFFRLVEETGIELYQQDVGLGKREVGTVMVHEWNIPGGRASRRFSRLKVNVWELPSEHDPWHRSKEHAGSPEDGVQFIGALATSRVQELEAIYEEQASAQERAHQHSLARAEVEHLHTLQEETLGVERIAEVRQVESLEHRQSRLAELEHLGQEQELKREEERNLERM